MLVIEEVMKAVVARNYHNMVRIGPEKDIRSANTASSHVWIHTAAAVWIHRGPLAVRRRRSWAWTGRTHQDQAHSTQCKVLDI